MSKLSLLLGSYLLASIIYWFSYIKIRGRMTYSNRKKRLFVSNLLLGLALIVIIPLDLYIKGVIRTPVIIVLAILMGASFLLHHISVLKDLHPWQGIITPRWVKVSLVHGAGTHLSFSAPFLAYCLVLFSSINKMVSRGLESALLYLLVSLNLIAGFIVMFDGVRMFRSHRRK